MLFNGHTIDNQPLAAWKAIYTACRKFQRFIVEVREYNEAAEISEQQRKWWKGILLPALAKDNGEPVYVWETRLKLAVLPDDFAPEYAEIDGETYSFVPSITKLSIKKMNTLIEGSVDWLRNNGFDWVMLPDSTLRKS